MIGFGMGHTLRHELIQSHKKNEIGLRKLLKLEQKLRHKDIPNVLKGFGGMIIADDILKEREVTGVLIGSLPMSIWQGKSIEDYYKHKDVDVAILSKKFKLKEPFENGIDWWLPTPKIEEYFDDSTQTNYNQSELVLQNGYGCVLNYLLKGDNIELNPGLYIPSFGGLMDIKTTEAETEAEKRDLDIGYEVFDQYIDLKERKLKKPDERFYEFFGNQILDDTDIYNMLGGIDPEFLVQLNRE